MTRRVLRNGLLVEEWDDAEQVYGWLSGETWCTRPYTGAERAIASTTPPPDPPVTDQGDPAR